jgi:hypothetical protein
MKFRVLFAAFLLLCGSVKAQEFGSIGGTLIDKTTKEPIQFSLITLTPEHRIAKSDTSGNFKIDSIPLGFHELLISAENYENLVLDYIRIIPGKTLSYTIELAPITEKMGVISINKRQNNLINSVPISMYTFNREEISMNPGAQGDIFRAIGMLPGVSSSGGIYSAISVRGQGVRDNVYMVDDIPVTEVGHLEGNSFFNDPNGGRFSIFAPRVIEKAIFQGGGFASEFGRRSASLLSLQVQEGNRKNLIVDGQMDLLGLTINFDGPIKQLKNTQYFLSLRYQNFLGLVNVVGLKDIGLPRYADIIAKTVTQKNNRKITTLLVISPERYTRDINHARADKNLNLMYLPDFYRNKTIAGITVKSRISNRLDVKNVVYFTDYFSDINVGKAIPFTDSTGKLTQRINSTLTNLQVQNYYEQKLGFRSILTLSVNAKNTLLIGIEGDNTRIFNRRRQNYLDTQYIYYKGQNLPGQNYLIINPTFVNSDFDASTRNFSSYVNLNKKLTQRWTLNLGLRHDYNGFAKQHTFGPRLNSSIALPNLQSINLAWGIYWQDPVLSDIADHGLQNPLTMEKNTHYIIAYHKSFSNSSRFIAEAWYKDFTNLITRPILGYVFQLNSGSGFGYGVDFNYSKKLSKAISGQLGYSYMQSKRRNAAYEMLYPFAFDQPNQINLLINYKFSSKFIASVKYRYATGKPSDEFIVHNNVFNTADYYRFSKEITGVNQQRLPDFNSLDIRINYSFYWKKINITAFFDAVNVRNKQIPNFENFNSFSGKSYFDGLAIFPTGGMKFEF